MGKKVIQTDKAADWGDLPYSQGVVAGDFVFVSGQLGIDRATGKPADGVKRQTELVLDNIRAILEAAGCSLNDVVKTTCYLTNRQSDYAGYNEVYRRYFKGDYPARVTVEVSNLAPGYVIEIDAVALLPKST